MSEINDFDWVDASAVVIAIGIATVMFRPSIRDSELWRATVTPLASIIGSGFLIVAPLLAAIAGSQAALAMSAIAVFSLWIGSALRFNIVHDGESLTFTSVRYAEGLERVSDLALGFAYLVSIAFYIRLMCGFILTGFDLFTEFNADVLATIVLTFIGAWGYRRGLKGLERLEEYSVTIKLAIIGALLAGLVFHGSLHGFTVEGVMPSVSNSWERLRLLGGMLLIVQGFETSKYLRSAYSRTVRVRSMLRAQILAAAIYVSFVALALPLMSTLAGLAPSETAIIDIAIRVTPVLPLMLILAAVMSQFSAAIADTIGAGGVVSEETRDRLSARSTYPIITLISVILVWRTNIFEIVAFASRAFALYYLLQALLAVRLSAAFQSGARRRLTIASYATLALILLAIVLFAVAVEV
ncbi:MAG: hypothetical protein PVH91_01645 [Pseudomonadales bacterium]